MGTGCFNNDKEHKCMFYDYNSGDTLSWKMKETQAAKDWHEIKVWHTIYCKFKNVKS